MASNRYPNRGAAARPQPGPDIHLPKVRPIPANDNLPPKWGLPANDNFPGKIPKPFGQPRVKPGWIGGVIRGPLLGRLLPFIGWMLLAYDLWELYQWYMRNNQSNYAGQGVCVPEANWINPLYPTNRWGWRSSSNCGPNPGPGVGLPTSIPAQPFGSNYLFLHHLAFMSTQEIQDFRWWYYPTPWDGKNPLDGGMIPMPIPLERPVPEEWWDPMTLPPLGPMPRPVSPPVRRPLFPDGRPEGTLRGNVEPGFTPDLRASPQPYPRPQRPPPKTKERKIKGQQGGIRKFLGWVVSNASEAFDLLDALHDALPKKYQAKPGATLKEKFDALYANSDKIDMAKAMEGIINDAATDKYYAEVFEKFQDVMESYGIDVASLRI